MYNLDTLLGLILCISFFNINFPDSKIDATFFVCILLSACFYWAFKDSFLKNWCIIFCFYIIYIIYSCRVHIIEYIYNGMIKLKENIIFVLTNKWIMLFSSFFFITIFGDFKGRDDIYMNIIIVYIILINIFITIDITRNRFEFERNKEVFYSVIASMIWMIYCIVQYMKDI